MKLVLFMSMLFILFTISIYSQTTWTPPETPTNRIGVIGNVWHPVGVIVNKDLGGWGLYATAKSNLEVHQSPMMNQFNFTGGLSLKMFTNTARSLASDLMVGVSYNTDPKNLAYANVDSEWGIEILLMTPFVDNNFRLIVGWSSNANEALYGTTLGFAYQF